MREVLDRIATHAREPTAPPDQHLDRFWYGLAQPFLGLRTLSQTPALRQRALVPVLAVLVIAAILVGSTFLSASPGKILVRYYGAIMGLASVPSVLFARAYELLAADALAVFGFGTRAPLHSTLMARVAQAARAAVLVGVALLPLVIALELLPLVGDGLALVASGMWTLHWIVVEAFDAARVADPRPSPASPSPPWFVAWTSAPAWDEVPALGRAVRAFGRVLTRLSRPWAEEIALAARHPALAVGFGLATAALLAIPVANLLLRPAIVVGAVHLRAQLAARAG